MASARSRRRASLVLKLGTRVGSRLDESHPRPPPAEAAAHSTEQLCDDHARPRWRCWLMREVYGPAPWERAAQERRFKQKRQHFV